jgi:hypothetical protein
MPTNHAPTDSASILAFAMDASKSPNILPALS